MLKTWLKKSRQIIHLNYYGMKKYLFGLFALIGVAVFSAFTLSGESRESATTEYYFFEVIDGEVNPLAPLNENPMTLEAFRLQNEINCPEGDTEDCIRGWTGAPPYPSALGEVSITKQ